MSWKSLDTAPRDGTEILIRYPMQGNVKSLVFWNKTHGYWMNKGLPVLGLDAQKVDWHPLPPDGVPVPCPLCGYQHGHAIGCANNPVDIALTAGVVVDHHQTFSRKGKDDPQP